MPGGELISAVQLLRLELAVLTVFAVLLLGIPRVTIRVFGLPGEGSGFWPRMLGAGALGLAIAALAADQGWTKSGLGLGGFVALNLTIALVLATLLVVGASLPTKRGQAILWVVVAIHAVLGFVQIAYA